MRKVLNKDPRLILAIKPENILSFGPENPSLTLEKLNVLIGPNGTGKSNLIEVIALMRSAASDIRGVVRKGGGVIEWVWKGKENAIASVNWIVKYPQGHQSLRHYLSFRRDEQNFKLVEERIEDEKYPHYSNPKKPTDQGFYYLFLTEFHMVGTVEGKKHKLASDTVIRDLPILAQRRDPERYPQLFFLSDIYEKIRIYREWTFGRNTVFREPQKADMRNDRLEEDFSNLGLFLNRLRRFPKAKAAILEGLQDLYSGVTDFDVIIEGGTVQVFFTEGDFTIPATRLSDGTLRYLCLLAILCDPEPPPLICIEEPELGLHPDIIPKLADLLIAASERTQLIVTTHSDILIDALSERPEAVVVCEKHDGQTTMRRLQKSELAAWLEKYRLGQLWTQGQIGGTRW